jgi:hypothetical protein
MADLIQVPALKVSPTGASNATAWRNNLIPFASSSGVAAHLDGELRPASQEQDDLEKHAKDQATAVRAIINIVKDTILHSALADMTGQLFDHLPHLLCKSLVLYATKKMERHTI